MKQIYVFIISIALIILLVFWIGPSNIMEALKSANWWLILLAVLIHLLVVGIRSLRWGFIINQSKEFRKNYIVKTIGLFAGNISPMRSAGEILNAVAGKNINKISISEGLSAGLTERFFDLSMAGALLIIVGFTMPKFKYIAIIGGLITISLVLVLYLVNWNEKASLWLYKKLHSILHKLPINKNKLDSLYEKMSNGLQNMIEYTQSFTNFRNLIFVLLLTTISWLMECLRLYVVLSAFNVKIDFLAVIVIFFLANLIGIISILPGGIGSIEISLTALFVLFGVPGSLAGTIALTDRLVSFWLVSILGVIFSTYYAKDILYEIKGYFISFNAPKS
ncbi:MAG: UPF0104 family protein [Methanobacterium sp.]